MVRKDRRTDRREVGTVSSFDPRLGITPSMRGPVSVKYVFLSFSFLVRMFFSSLPLCEFLPLSQAAPVATLPSALFVERWSLGAIWVYSIQ